MTTKIEWTDETWNPVTGCSPISEGCDHCYAARMANRLAGRCGYPKENPFNVTIHPERLSQPSHWKKPRHVFVCSMGDLFHPLVALEYQAKVFDAMAWHAQHTFQVLTKRPAFALNTINYLRSEHPEVMRQELRNVWIGASVEKQRFAKDRLAPLCSIEAGKRFVSLEPLLGPVELGPWIGWLDWVIVGAETGPGARPMNPEWALSVRDQCAKVGVPFFFKKDSDGSRELEGKVYEEWPE